MPTGILKWLCMQGTKDFTLTLACRTCFMEVAGNFFYLYDNRNLTIRGPLALDAEPFRFSQCEVTSSNGETYLELRPMPGYEPPCTDSKFWCLTHWSAYSPLGRCGRKAARRPGTGGTA